MPVRPLEPTLTPVVRRRPEILAPAGDLDSLKAALAAGADAVYFGLDDGFNARARATNLSRSTLPDVVERVHRAGARAYVTLNTLIFEPELEPVAEVIADVARSGVDALIVQDPAVALLARAICDDIELHASTQLTISSAEGVRFATQLGFTRVVVPRELSVSEIAALADATDVELEVFIHGALCMSWSGQCLSSEAWGGRSANRGQCAQACRMPYELVVDGQTAPMSDVRYLLSPRDLAGLRAVPALMQIGVHTLKIEGRLKGPAYVKTAVEGYRRWLDTIEREAAEEPASIARLADDLAAMMVTYSRGFSDGFLAGSDHQTLVDGRFPKHRGALLGVVAEVRGDEVRVVPAPRVERPARGEVVSPLPALGGAVDAATGAAATPVHPAAGMGVVFDAGRPEDPNEPGGPVFAARAEGDGWWLRFGRPGPDLGRVSLGDRVWVTGDPALQRDAERALSTEPEGRLGVRLRVWGTAGAALHVEASCRGVHVGVETDVVAESATAGGLDAGLLIAKLGAFGGTPYRLDGLDTDGLASGLHVPVSALKRARRALVAALEAQLTTGREVREVPEIARMREALGAKIPATRREWPAPHVVALCRTPEQLEAAIEVGVERVELDWMEMVGLGRAFDRAREAGLHVTVATVRVQKPGEEGFDRRIARLAPDGVLVRHWGALMYFAEHPDVRRSIEVHGDFSLNVTNSLTARHVLALGLDTVTAAHDLDRVQLSALLDQTPADRLAVTVHHHIATFHTEHCVYAHTLSEGRDFRTCGRPCEEHRVHLRDHLGFEHPVIVDVGCRNTVFNARAQSAASLVPGLIRRGVRHFRVECVWEDGEETARTLVAWQRLLRGELGPAELVAEVSVHEQFGVTAGTMQVLR